MMACMSFLGLLRLGLASTGSLETFEKENPLEQRRLAQHSCQQLKPRWKIIQLYSHAVLDCLRISVAAYAYNGPQNKDLWGRLFPRASAEAPAVTPLDTQKPII